MARGGQGIARAHSHHKTPNNFLLGTFWQRNSATMAMAALIGVCATLIGGLNIVTVTAVLVGAMANEIHAYAHRKRVPVWAQFMQLFGFMQSKGHHNAHHLKGGPNRYCAITNWLNPALDHIEFWKALEMGVFFCSLWFTPKDGAK